MIKHIEKGWGLTLFIEEAGEWLKEIGNEWKSSNDVVVQSLIDNYDPVPYEQGEAKARIVEQANEAMQSLEDMYPSFEKQTWPYQKAEVEAWVLDSEALTPTIDAIVLVRGNDRLTHLSKTAGKITAYHTLSTQYAGERQRLEDVIDAETDWRVIQNINFEVS